MRTWIGLAALLLPSAAGAQTLELTLNQQAVDAGLDEQAIEQSLNSAIGEALKLGSQDQHDQFIDSMVEAAAISAKGMGVDYASNIEKVVVGGSISSGVHEAGFSFNRGGDLLPKGGFGAQISLMAGINVGMGGKGDDRNALDRVRLYVNGMAMRLPSDRSFGGQMANLGGHLQLKLVEGNPEAKILQWGGLDLTSGFEYSAYSFDLRKEVPIDAPLGGGSGSATWNATGTYNINSDVMSVPLELSTNLRVLVFTTYLGGALDYNMGTGSSVADMAGPIDGRVLAPDGSTFDGNLGSARVTANAFGESIPTTFRMFLGAQVNVMVLKAFGHLNVSPQPDAMAVGGHVGFRVAM